MPSLQICSEEGKKAQSRWNLECLAHIRIDKMHMRGHKDEDCKKKYDANNDHDLDGVNTQIAKQTFQDKFIQKCQIN